MKSAKHPPEIAAFLANLDEVFQKTRKKTVALYPYNQQTHTSVLPPQIEKTLRNLVLAGNGIEAVKRVTELTGAGLRVSKDYVDNLALADRGFGRSAAFYRVAQAISETLPLESKEKKLLDGFLAGRDRVQQEVEKEGMQEKLL